MPINLEAVGLTGTPMRRTWNSKDALLYALGVGAGTQELAYTTENSKGTPQQVLPTFGVIIGAGGVPFEKLGKFNFAMMVHAEQGLELFGPIPTSGEIEIIGKCVGVWDKGSGALIAMESEAVNIADKKPLLKNRMSIFIRGEGGFGGERGSSEKFEFPDRAPDHTVTYKTREDQALLYRLSGDRNPLHSDPAFAKMGGFDRPILHGLCTYGFTGRALLHTLCGGEASRFKSIQGRFSKPVFPGEDLTVCMWVDGNECRFRTQNPEGVAVIDHGLMKFEN